MRLKSQVAAPRPAPRPRRPAHPLSRATARPRGRDSVIPGAQPRHPDSQGGGRGPRRREPPPRTPGPGTPGDPLRRPAGDSVPEGLWVLPPRATRHFPCLRADNRKLGCRAPRPPPPGTVDPAPRRRRRPARATPLCAFPELSSEWLC